MGAAAQLSRCDGGRLHFLQLRRRCTVAPQFYGNKNQTYGAMFCVGAEPSGHNGRVSLSQLFACVGDRLPGGIVHF